MPDLPLTPETEVNQMEVNIGTIPTITELLGNDVPLGTNSADEGSEESVPALDDIAEEESDKELD